MGWLNQQARLCGLIGSGTDPVATRVWPSPQVVPREWRGRCLRRRRGWSWRFQRSRVRASGELALWDRNDRAGAHSHWPNNLVALMTCDLNLKPPRDGAVYARFEEQRQVYASPSPKRLLFLMGLWRGGWLRQRGHTKNPAIGNLRAIYDASIEKHGLAIEKSRRTAQARAKSNPLRPHGCRQSQIAKQSLPINASFKETELPTEKAALARFAKEVEQGPVFRCHVRPKLLERRDVEGGPLLEVAGFQHLQSTDAVAPADVCSNHIVRMSAIANGW